MAKLAQQIIAIQISKAVPDSASDELAVVNSTNHKAIIETIEKMVGTGAVVEILQTEE